ncbi:uncharacterized protein LY79DRAFT_695482 [Colletotrichum navitas]|uniref:Short chain dehydrogenase n=1 Tax=Colletotrichum navitas TaxID=681940 RepID=A0AAD8PR85_9PEZI|nr:uncharacterized protein LY79DRAFT_695482 [Colletotrichum navitas]KAK1574371.1 hypothetical protein LY79DRAFT_695482 [Colletotrichum navitas]
MGVMASAVWTNVLVALSSQHNQTGVLPRLAHNKVKRNLQDKSPKSICWTGKRCVSWAVLGGLGLLMAVEFAKQGASVIIIRARNPKTLGTAKAEIMAARQSEEQAVHAIAVDLSDYIALRNAMSEHDATPDVLICSVGGTTPAQIGFLADLTPEGLVSCFESNYNAALCITQWCVQRWIKFPDSKRTRRLVYIASSAAFVALPGYIVYTPPKTAVRALADTLRQELLLYGDENMYRVHIAFPAAFTTDAFLQEQAAKPKLLKQMEISDYATKEELFNKIQSVEEIVTGILDGIKKGHFIITTDMTTDLTLNNMRGPSPRSSPLYDCFMSFVGALAFPMVRQKFDKMTSQYGRDKGLRK